MFRKNVASQFLYFGLINASTGAALTGATVSARRCIDGTFAAGGGTVTEDTGLGFYKYAMSQADTNGNDISFFFTATSAIPVEKTIVTTAGDPTDTVRFGLTALPNAAANAAGGLPVSIAGALDLDEMNVDIEAIQTSTAGLTFTGAGKVDASVRDWVGDTIPARNVTGVPIADTKYVTGTLQTATDIGTKAASLTFTVANKVDCNPLAINGDATSAANLAKTTRAIGRGTASGVPTTISIPTSAFAPAGAAADQFKGRIITFDADTTTTALRGQSTDITASSNAATPTLTVTALTTAPVSGDTFSLT